MCKCITMTDEALKEKGIRLCTGIRFSKDMTTATAFIPVQLEKINKSDRKVKLPTLVPSYCVFCGEKLFPEVT